MQALKPIHDAGARVTEAATAPVREARDAITDWLQGQASAAWSGVRSRIDDVYDRWLGRASRATKVAATAAWYLSLISLMTLVCVGISSLLYLLLYWILVPKSLHVYPLHFEYHSLDHSELMGRPLHAPHSNGGAGGTDGAAFHRPTAIVDLSLDDGRRALSTSRHPHRHDADAGQWLQSVGLFEAAHGSGSHRHSTPTVARPLSPGQGYEFEIELTLPDTYANRDEWYSSASDAAAADGRDQCGGDSNAEHGNGNWFGAGSSGRRYRCNHGRDSYFEMGGHSKAAAAAAGSTFTIHVDLLGAAPMRRVVPVEPGHRRYQDDHGRYPAPGFDQLHTAAGTASPATIGAPPNAAASSQPPPPAAAAAGTVVPVAVPMTAATIEVDGTATIRLMTGDAQEAAAPASSAASFEDTTLASPPQKVVHGSAATAAATFAPLDNVVQRAQAAAASAAASAHAAAIAAETAHQLMEEKRIIDAVRRQPSLGHGIGQTSLARCSRSLVLPHTPWIYRAVHRVVRLPLWLAGLVDATGATKYTISCFEGYVERESEPEHHHEHQHHGHATHHGHHHSFGHGDDGYGAPGSGWLDPLATRGVRVTLSHPRVQVTHATLTIHTRMRGLTFYMHHHLYWVLTAAIAIGIMASCGLISCCIGCGLLKRLFRMPLWMQMGLVLVPPPWEWESSQDETQQQRRQQDGVAGRRQRDRTSAQAPQSAAAATGALGGSTVVSEYQRWKDGKSSALPDDGQTNAGGGGNFNVKPQRDDDRRYGSIAAAAAAAMVAGVADGTSPPLLHSHHHQHEARSGGTATHAPDGRSSTHDRGAMAVDRQHRSPSRKSASKQSLRPPSTEPTREPASAAVSSSADGRHDHCGAGVPGDDDQHDRQQPQQPSIAALVQESVESADAGLVQESAESADASLGSGMGGGSKRSSSTHVHSGGGGT